MQKTAFTAIKWIVTVAFLWVVYRYVIKIDNLNAIWNSMQTIPLWLFLLAGISSCLNWFIESVKWQYLMSNLEKLSIYISIKSTLAGSTVSNIFPFRVGEYLGKILFVKPDNRVPAIFNSMFGGSCQMVISMLFGIPALFYLFGYQYKKEITTAALSVVAVLTLFTLIFIFSSKIKKIRIAWLQKIIEDIKKFTLKQICMTLMLSLLRYLVFGGFYAFLLFQCGFGNTYLLSCIAVAAIYVIQSLSPSMILTDAGMRSAVPVLIFSPALNQQPTLIAIALVNYFFNLIFPAILGLYFIIVFKFKNR